MATKTSPLALDLKPFTVTDGRRFVLRNADPGDTGGIKSKARALATVERDVARLAALQERLYAEDSHGLLLIFQAMDAAGKDGAIEHVMSGINPQGCQVFSFKAPSAEELDHDFLWRTTRCLPERGRIGIFNRSYYEETLVVRVHPQFLQGQRLPPALVTKRIWKERFEDINAFERHMARNGFVIRKFFLHISSDEQKRRFLSRLEEPEKNWKFSIADARERESWDQYMAAYEDMIRHTSTPWAPWIVVPSNHKWFSRLVVAAAVVKALEQIDPKFPTVDAAKRKDLEAVRAALELEGTDARAGRRPTRRGSVRGRRA
jgi:PPK2 family polyphosphate:nucleotide phosphotransferase